MQTQSKVLLGVGLIIMVFIGFSMTKDTGSTAVTQTSPNEAETMTDDAMTDTEVMSDVDEADQAMMDDGAEAMMNDDKMVDSEEMDSSAMDNHESTMTEPEVTTTAVPQKVAGQFLDYSPNAVTTSEADHIVLHFSATWCPSCRTIDKDINASLSDIPDGLEIYKVDYDTNIDLRKKYGVTTQHTFVKVDAAGNKINKWTGGTTLEDVLAKI